MAREFRRIGIRTAEVRLPAPASVGPALLKTASGIADRAFAAQSDKRTQEAQVAAAALNFERDAEGNLQAPSLPIGENGLLAPSIYDRTYTTMVGQRYIQQLDVDVSERLNTIASEHILDPDGYAVVAEAYVNRVTDLAPDMLKPDVNMSAQRTMVEHFNRITRNRSEFDWTDSRNQQIAAIDRSVEEAQSAAVAGDDDLVMEQYIKMEAGLLQGQEPNFWSDAYPEARREAFNEQLISSYIIGDVVRLPNDEVSMSLAAEAVQDFVDGNAKVKVIKNGEMVMMDVKDAMPNEEKRAIIGANAIKAIGNREAAFVNVENARDQRQFDEFLEKFMRQAVAAEFVGQQADRNWLLTEFDKADATGNEPLKARIRAELKQAMPTGGTLTEYEKDYFAQAQDMIERTLAAQDIYATKQGVERFELLTPETQKAFNDSLPPLIGVFALDQTKEGARLADQVYENMAPDLVWQSADQGGSPFESLDHFIKTQMQGLGLVPKTAINYFQNTLGNIEQAGGEEVMRVASLFESMRATPNLRGKLKSALGEANFAALAFMSDNMLPSQVRDTAILTDVVKRAHNGNLYDPWKAMSEDARAVMKEQMVTTLKAHNTPWLGKNGAAIPFELLMEAEQKIPGVAHLLGIDPSDGQLEAIAETIVNELVTSRDSRWRLDPIGLNADKARTFGMHGPDFFEGTALGSALSKQPATGYAEYPPMYWAELWASDHTASPKEIHRDAIMPALQEQLNLIQSPVKLRAGENVHVLYNAGQSVLAQEPAFEMYITVKGGDAEQITTDGKWNGEPVYFYPQDSVLKLRQEMMDAEELDEDERIRKQQERDAMPMVPNDKNVPRIP